VTGDGLSSRDRILVRGAGELASAAAHRLFRCGFRVAMTDLASPTAVRRTVSFCTAITDGSAQVEGVRGVRYTLAEADLLPGFAWDQVPVFVDPEGRLRTLWKPDVVVDARMLKRNADDRIDEAGLVIGLGPGLEAGRDVHFVVETHRGHHLGRIIAHGCAAGDTGEPGEVGGYTRERVLRAPVAGRFETTRRIGDLVSAGEPVVAVGGREVCSAIDGLLRGLLPAGLEVTAGQKLGDVDPRNDRSFCHTLSDKARTISGSVLEIVVAYVRGVPIPRS
jgi:xanthine dehydrogenase accessory factor